MPRRALAAAAAAVATLSGCGGGEPPERVAVTLYAGGPRGAERPAMKAVKDAIAARGGRTGIYRVTFSWQGADDREEALRAARRAVEDPRAVAFVTEARGEAARAAIALLNQAGVPVVSVGDPALARLLCRDRDLYPSGLRTAVAPPGAAEAERARLGTDAILDALRPLPPDFDRRPVIRALVARFGAC